MGIYVCVDQWRRIWRCSIFKVGPQSAPRRDPSIEGRLVSSVVDWTLEVEYFSEIMNNRAYLMSGNRCDFKRASDPAHFLFDFNDGRVRAHWEDRPYRKLYRRAVMGISVALGGRQFGRWLSRQLFWQLFETHWILPYPCAEVLLQTTKGGERMWYSIMRVTSTDAEGRETEKWVWGRKQWEEGRPRERAGWVGWNREEWEGWIERQGAG
jgi:hypothetical protein